MVASRALHSLATQAGQVVDGTVIALMRNVFWRGKVSDPGRLEQLLHLAEVYGQREFFEHPDHFFRMPRPARVRATHRGDTAGGGMVVDLAYASEYEPHLLRYRNEHVSYEENLTAHARWFKRGRPRPTVICIHGMGTGAFPFEERAFSVHGWIAAGFDVVLFQLPFHGNRKPRRRWADTLFPSPHLVRTNEAFGQAVSDLRALIAWLRERDVPEIGLMGVSLGGYTTALMTTLERDLAFAVPIIPAVSIAEGMWRLGPDSSLEAARSAGITEGLFERIFAVHSPLARPPRLAHERRFIVAARGDQICPPQHAEALWEHWSRPPIHWFPGSHLAQIGRDAAFQRVARWLGQLGLTATTPAASAAP